jgi:hypothetical protein
LLGTILQNDDNKGADQNRRFPLTILLSFSEDQARQLLAAQLILRAKAVLEPAKRIIRHQQGQLPETVKNPPKVD